MTEKILDYEHYSIMTSLGAYAFQHFIRQFFLFLRDKPQSPHRDKNICFARTTGHLIEYYLFIRVINIFILRRKNGSMINVNVRCVHAGF